jgi:hypothetical protein
MCGRFLSGSIVQSPFAHLALLFCLGCAQQGKQGVTSGDLCISPSRLHFRACWPQLLCPNAPVLPKAVIILLMHYRHTAMRCMAALATFKLPQSWPGSSWQPCIRLQAR